MELNNFNYFSTQASKSLTNIRQGEVKLGERISCGPLSTSQKKFVVLGISESIGVKANLGIAGTHSAWDAFIIKFLNIQATDLLPVEDIHILGHFQFNELYERCESIEDYREATAQIDSCVTPLIRSLNEQGHLPIIIGGSHANAFPVIKGTSQSLKQGIHVVNLDAHADFRNLEGRHSGNPFSYAYEQGYMSQYHVLGLHENYNSQAMIKQMDKTEGISYISWEDIFLRSKLSYEQALEKTFALAGSNACGVELDLDSIENVLSSAIGPSGFSVTQARQYAYKAAHQTNACYLHLCEGAAFLEGGEHSSTIGKLLSYLLSDFLKGCVEKQP